MISEAIKKIVDKQDLSFDEAYAVMHEIMEGKTTQTQNAAFLAALSTKSTRAETIDEICGCAKAMRECARPVPYAGDVLEIVGTGGDKSMSFNISTTAALICAGAGIKVAKHGNRSATSACGAADCLEALGVTIQQTPECCQKLLDELGICFIFAQTYHQSMKYVAPIRRELGVRTVFNILGPLTNPAHPRMQVLGVYDEYLCEPLAKVLDKLGVKRALVVYGRDCLDEISLSAPTKVCELKDGNISTYMIRPEDFGFMPCEKSALKGGMPARNAEITRAVLEGAKGAFRDAAVMNAAAGIYLAGKAKTLVEGARKAEEAIDSGQALHVLNEFVRLSKLYAADDAGAGVSAGAGANANAGAGASDNVQHN